jgi:hypothetical protein
MLTGPYATDARLLGMELGLTSRELKLASGELINKVQVKASVT